MEKTVIVSIARTPVGKFGGSLKNFSAADLGGIAIKAAVERATIDPAEVDYAFMGHVLQGGCGQVTSRQATRNGELPWEVPSITINKVCASGLSSAALGDQRIKAGLSSVVVAGGMESMSSAPYALKNNRWGARMGNGTTLDLMIHDGLWCSFYDRHMAVHGSEVSEELGISREAQDEWAWQSQMKAKVAMESGRFKEEIIPVEIKSKKGTAIFDADESPRPETTMEGLAKLPPVFTKDGTVTAGNAPGVNDGAAALVLMSETKAKDLNLEVLAEIIGHEEVSEEAKYIATVPGRSTLKLLEKHDMKVSDIDIFEINEAFAAVVLASEQIVGWDPKKVNVDGGAVAFGHPIGASGARILMHTIQALRARGGGYGVAAICSGAAQGDAMLIKVN